MDVFEATLEARICKHLRDAEGVGGTVMMTFEDCSSIDYVVTTYTPMICKEIQIASKRFKKRMGCCMSCRATGVELDCAHTVPRPQLCREGLTRVLNAAQSKSLSLPRVIAAMLQAHLGTEHFVLCKTCHRALDGTDAEMSTSVREQIQLFSGQTSLDLYPSQDIPIANVDSRS